MRELPFFCPSPATTPDYLDKLCTRDTLPIRLPRLARPLVFTNGVFDILHRGHVQYLAQAHSLGQSLLVALNTDASVRRLGKGADRPLHAERDRAEVIAALASTDLVTWFDEDTPLALLELVRPEIYVKGGDYDVETLPETPLVRSWGGTALTVPFVTGYSTTTLVQRIRAATQG
ncbi:D-glycero-beta-D-manno-heptose 1-phosphate adenylyltransferase [Candidatus Symbiobacter mobilis]|uniref:D-glycero-beta-D-manno-heptose 1-phosphate adenylyltransferase n=1 Tax=Candidatus Symbiobacter mobilis CR TaxID=946483 RepID=U5N8E0_9BURK|nr:D-glycero-beta-D-manno-heptose 1-phosphate adenylyltransferase [Candidatus Symbiobacter mobilis]AGX86434.1 sugar metabolism enzyme [Candidatus Symbiobacter mobilis CR]